MTQPRPNRQQRRHPPSHTTGEAGTQLTIPYLKSTAVPVLHADGVFGGMTPAGLIYIAFFTEHAKLPQSALITVDAEGRAIQAKQARQESEWVRDVGVELIIDLRLARSFRNWLDDKIKAVEAMRSPATVSPSEEVRDGDGDGESNTTQSRDPKPDGNASR